jgi:signal transduction histidine kinase
MQSLKVLKAEEELQRKLELEKERTRIATDMHDDLGAGLTGIKFLSETIAEYNVSKATKERLEKIKGSANKLIESMGEIIWAMNEKNNTLEDLLFYLRNYSLTYCEENNLACRFNLPENTGEQIINGYTRRNIFLIVKECLHNIVKHGNAKNVDFKIAIDKELVFEIQDDGKGFYPRESVGNGMINMRKRSKEMNGSFVVFNNNGTSIQISVPMPG